MTTIRICLICTEKLPVPPIRGGAIQTYIDAVAPRLTRAHEVTVICRQDPALPADEWRGPVRFVRVPASEGKGGAPRSEPPGARPGPDGMIAGPARLASVTSAPEGRLTPGDPATYFRNVAAWLAGETAFDLVLLYNRPAYAAAVAKAARGARLALSMHNDMFGPDRIGSANARAALERAEVVFCVSDYVRLNIERAYPAYRRKLRTVYAGVDTVRFAPLWAKAQERAGIRKRFGLDPQDPVVLHVSRFSARKGNQLLIGAMEQVVTAHPRAKLLVVGSSRYGSDELDEYGRTFQQLTRERLGEAARFAGFVPPADVADYYLAGDLFVVASQWQEPLARVHYEAMATGLPIVTTDRGGNCEVVEEGLSALVARPYDESAAFAREISRLLAEPDLRERLGRRGRELVEERYTWDRVAGELLATFAARR